jgi:ribosomal protein S18 acetylase RimI-like enzyme
MKLEVNRLNLPAVQLYRQLGFKVFENYEVYIIYVDL